MEEKTESKVNIDIETEFVEVACERCGEKFFAVRGARERMLSGSGQIICTACQREEELRVFNS